MRNVLFAALLVLAFLAGIAWQRSMSKPRVEAGDAVGTGPVAGSPHDATDPAQGIGVRWDVPQRWVERAAGSMRLATYEIPAKSGDPAECAVFYFGPGQGGDVEANLQRWEEQFENPRGMSRTTKTYGGMKVERIVVEGDYLAPSGPMMESTGRKQGYRLDGAIVEGPNGSVFFKLTGPGRAVESAKGEFDGLLESLRAG